MKTSLNVSEPFGRAGAVLSESLQALDLKKSPLTHRRSGRSTHHRRRNVFSLWQIQVKSLEYAARQSWWVRKGIQCFKTNLDGFIQGKVSNRDET